MPKLDARERKPFWEKVERAAPDQCWPWLGYCKKSGHGLTSHNSHPMHASRKAWILTHGEIRSELSVLHKCDNALCCNPLHMYLGTRADNMIDRFGYAAPEDRQQRGRPTVLTREQIAEMWEMRRQGKQLRECAAKFGVHVATVCRYITAHRKTILQKNMADRLARNSR